jgi:DNA-binding GntR family transcriptional regulator
MHKVKHLDLSEKVYNALKNMILNDELKSGEKLNQEKLAKKLGVSRTPLLSAFSKLEKEVLVEIIPRRGAFVKKLNYKEFLDLYDIRTRLEPLGAYEAARQATINEIEQLSKVLSHFEKNILLDSLEHISKIDYDFHMVIMKISNNDLLYKMISSFNIIILSNLEGLLKDPRQSLEEHIKIFNAIKEHNAELAEKVMYAHLIDSRGRIREKILKDSKEKKVR